MCRCSTTQQEVKERRRLAKLLRLLIRSLLHTAKTTPATVFFLTVETSRRHRSSVFTITAQPGPPSRLIRGPEFAQSAVLIRRASVRRPAPFCLRGAVADGADASAALENVVFQPAWCQSSTWLFSLCLGLVRVHNRQGQNWN